MVRMGLLFVMSRGRGQSLVEYTLLFALITLVVVVALILLGPQLAGQYRSIEHSV